jgi:hypothetical protein
MMKKLVVTVFAVSLAALGCGSDDGTPNKDSGPKLDGLPGLEVQVNGPEVQVNGPEVQVSGPEVGAPDKAPDVNVPIDGTTVVDGGAPDQPIVIIDGGDIDAPVTEAGPTVDTGAADAKATEAGPAVDGGTVDVGSRG